MADTDKIYEVLLEVKEQQGRQIALLESHVTAFKQHTDHDEDFQSKTNANFEQLHSWKNKQVGATRVWSMIFTVIGGAVGSAITFFLKSH